MIELQMQCERATTIFVCIFDFVYLTYMYLCKEECLVKNQRHWVVGVVLPCGSPPVWLAPGHMSSDTTQMLPLCRRNHSQHWEPLQGDHNNIQSKQRPEPQMKKIGRRYTPTLLIELRTILDLKIWKFKLLN